MGNTAGRAIVVAMGLVMTFTLSPAVILALYDPVVHAATDVHGSRHAKVPPEEHSR